MTKKGRKPLHYMGQDIVSMGWGWRWGWNRPSKPMIEVYNHTHHLSSGWDGALVEYSDTKKKTWKLIDTGHTLLGMLAMITSYTKDREEFLARHCSKPPDGYESEF